MIQMTATPKNIYQKCSIWLPMSILLAFISCKSSQVESSPEPEITQAQPKLQDGLSSSDSLEFVQLLRARESAILDYRESFPKDIEVVHVDLDLSFDFANQSVIGVARLLLTPHFYSTNQVRLDAKDYEMGRISLIQETENVKLSYQYDGSEVRIYLPDEIDRGDFILLELNYVAFPNRNPTAGSSAITDTKGLYFIDPLDTIPGKPTMIWTQGETEHNSKWFPMVDRPNQRFTQDFKLTVPDSMLSLSNGVLKSQENLGNGLRKDRWVMDIPHAPYLAALAIGNFGKVEDTWRETPLGYYVEKGFEAGAAEVFKNTPLMLEFFSQRLGVEFPWPKYDQVVVRDFVSGAMENTTLSIFMDDLRLDEREAIDSEWDYIIAHELFHQWFGDYVTTESWANLTLNEAFANYSEYLWNEHHYGRDVADLKLIAETENYFYEAQSKQENLIRFSYEDAEDMFDSHSYSKGGAILHMLRKVVGDEAFFESLQLYLRQNALQSVEVHDLRLAFEEVTGRDLNWFFNQWFLDKGHPNLVIQADYSQPENILLSVYQTQDLVPTRLFKIPFEVSWYVNGQRKAKTFVLERAFQQFALQNADSVGLVYFDEKKEILAVKSPSFTPKDWYTQFLESEFGVGRYEALDSLKEAGDEVLLQRAIKEGLSDSFTAIQEASLLALIGTPDYFLNDASLEETVFDLVIQSKDNSVRSTALDVLAANFAEKYGSTFKLLLNDPSYLVAGSALSGWIASEGGNLEPEAIKRFEQEDNFRLVIPVAEYFLNSGVIGKGEWFQEKVRSLSGDGLYYFLGYYGEYFSRNPSEGQEEAVKFLLKKMEKDSAVAQRLGAFQALLGFVDDPEVLAEMSRIAGLEQDDFVSQYFQYFLSSLEVEN
ncbi:M1 family aminopeptidase [Algoriphagus namhaensis]